MKLRRYAIFTTSYIMFTMFAISILYETIFQYFPDVFELQAFWFTI